MNKEPITKESLEAIIEYIDEGGQDMEVIKGELGELILRNKGVYLKEHTETA